MWFQAADTLLYSALFDEDQSVRYEAALLYMGHPKGKMIAPMNRLGSESLQDVLRTYSMHCKEETTSVLFFLNLLMSFSDGCTLLSRVGYILLLFL